ncbi:MAG: ROK family protein [Saprospiraceae bacterium]|nr:ROK family protein [Saprospiraceae bacterium]
METLWGIDMGGTKMEGIVINTHNNEVISRLRVPTESHLGYDHILDQIQLLIHKLETDSVQKPSRIGMCTPGTLDPILHVMKNCNTTSLNGRNLKADIEDATGLAFKLSNDANCFAIAETKMGVIKEEMPDANVVFGVIMGTGVGGGLVVDGRVIAGRQGIAGEWGHNFLGEDTLCYCGQKGCVENILSGPALEKYYLKISGKALSMINIVEAYRAGNDVYAQTTMSRLFEYFGKAMAVVINIVDPDAIVIGGGVGNIDELYHIGVEKVKDYVFNNRLDTMFFKPRLGDSAGVFGAAFL